MATFRVYLSRPITKPPVWDWAQTVVAPDAQTAVGHAYESWQNSHEPYTVPPLNQCRQQVKPSGTEAETLLGASSLSPAQQAFIDNIQSQVSKLLSTQLDGTFTTVVYPSGFNYGITYGNNAYYNQATLQDINTLLGTNSNGMIDLSGGGFSTLYAQILQAVTFSFSQQDSATMDKQDTAASAQVASVLTEFTNDGGVYSDPLPFGGKLQDVINQLTKQYGSLDHLPDSLNALRNAIATYESLAADSYALHNRYYAATVRVAAALNNTLHPSATNGGMQVDANTYYVGFTPDKLPSANQLIGGLSTSSNAVSVQITLDSFSSTSSNLSVSGGSSFIVPIVDILDIWVDGSSSYDLSRYTSSSSNVTMDITYPGVTLFGSLPSELSSDNSTGWYANDILKEVVANTGQDATGYKLQGTEFDVQTLFGPGNTFSRLKTFVISQQPTVKLTFTGVDASKVTSDFHEHMAVELDLFGLFRIGSRSSSYSVQSVENESASGTVTVTMGPPQVSGTIPLQQQVAYVVGGVAAYPPDNI